MYQLEGKVEADSEDDSTTQPNKINNNKTQNTAQNPTPTTAATGAPPPPSTADQGTAATEMYSELHDMWRHGSMVAENYGTITGDHVAAAAAADMNGPTLIRFGTSGTASGDVSLTLGLRHAGNAPADNPPFSVRNFGHS